jgi:hypothetical protein
MQNETNLHEWWQLIFENRCENYTHSQEDEYNEAPKAFFNIKHKT